MHTVASSAITPGRSARTAYALAGSIAVLTFALYLPTARFAFLQFDDPEYVVRNERVKSGVVLQNVGWAFATTELANWHPLTWISLMLDVQVFGPRAGAMHLVNAAIHAANAAMVFWLLAGTTGALWRSALVAAIFGVHPLRVESVAWISERKDVLCTLFGLLCLIVYSRYARRGGGLKLAAALILFALSLLSKPMLVTLPAVMLLLDYWPLRRRVPVARLVLEKLPFVLLAAVSSAITILVQHRGGPMRELLHLPLGLRLANAAVSYVHYIADTFWPANLAMLYPMPASIPQLLAAGAVAALLVISGSAIVTIRTRPPLLVGWAWYLLTLLPVIGIIAMGQQARADRYTYFPSIGLLLAIVWLAPSPRGRAMTATAAAACAAIIVALGLSTSAQLRHWRDTESLARRTIAVVGPLPSMHLYWGVSLAEAGRFDEAVAQYRRAVDLKPDYAPALYNLGNDMARRGQFEQAADLFQRAVAAQPAHARAHHNLATAMMQLGNFSQAERHFRIELNLQPGSAEAQRGLDAALRAQARQN